MKNLWRSNRPLFLWICAGAAAVIVLVVSVGVDAVVNPDEEARDPKQVAASEWVEAKLDEIHASESAAAADPEDRNTDFWAVDPIPTSEATTTAAPADDAVDDYDADSDGYDDYSGDDVADTALFLAAAEAPGEIADWPQSKVLEQAELVCELRNNTPDQDLELALALLASGDLEGLQLTDQAYFLGVGWVWCEETGR